MGVKTIMKAIKSSKAAVEIAKKLVTDWDKEHCIGLYLDSENKLKKATLISIGTLNVNFIHAREVYRPAVRHSAAGVVLLHNHPTGNVIPSKEDIKVTKRMKKAGEILDITLLDHIVFCRGELLYSMKGNKKF